MQTPADMTDAELRAALLRLSLERSRAGSKRREVIGRVCDLVLDTLLDRAAVQSNEAKPLGAETPSSF